MKSPPVVSERQSDRIRRLPAPDAVLNVLVVDDDSHARVAMASAVRALDHTCRVAVDGQDAWKLHREAPADVIVCDWNMPRMTGAELCRLVRASSPDAYVHFLFATGLDDKEHFAEGMKLGADDYFTKPVDLDKLAARFDAIARIVAENRTLRLQNARLRRDSQRLFLDSRHDQLTGLGNRRALQDALAAAGANVDRYGTPCCAAFCDIDRFKVFNDHFGHVAGDEVLRRVAGALRGSLRQGDSAHRYGGEEFVVLLADQRLASARIAAERLRGAVERLAIPAYPAGVVTMSVGVAERLAIAPGDNAAQANDAWLVQADEALYGAKLIGRNRVVA